MQMRQKNELLLAMNDSLKLRHAKEKYHTRCTEIHQIKIKIKFNFVLTLLGIT